MSVMNVAISDVGRVLVNCQMSLPFAVFVEKVSTIVGGLSHVLRGTEGGVRAQESIGNLSPLRAENGSTDKGVPTRVCQCIN